MHKSQVRILVVDDEPRYIWILQTNLEARGYAVLPATDGQQALELATSEEPDLIVLDIKMPGLDGFEVCRRIRESSAVPIIMLTALASLDDKIKGLDMGADDYVTKPFSAEELVARIQAVLRRVELSGRQDPRVFRAIDRRIACAQQRASTIPTLPILDSAGLDVTCQDEASAAVC